MMHVTEFPGKNQSLIRYGIMCYGTTFPAWIAYCLNRLLALDNVEPVLLIIDNGSLPQYNIESKLKENREKLISNKLMSFAISAIIVCVRGKNEPHKRSKKH